MARILHVDDKRFWRDLVRRQLSDHSVDSVSTLDEAISLLASGPAYRLALVDLNLETDSDGQGGELLDLLQLRYQSTGRIVVTATAPEGAVRKNIFDAYDVEEIIIKSQIDIPGLRRVVEEAIDRGGPALSQQGRLGRSLLRQRFRDWQRVQRARLTEERRAAELHLQDAEKASGQSQHLAQAAVDEAKKALEQFNGLCARLRTMFGSIRTEHDLDAALEALDAAEDQFGERPAEYGQ